MGGLSCPLCCQQDLGSIVALREHLLYVMYRPIICPVCCITFTGLQSIVQHLEEHLDMVDSSYSSPILPKVIKNVSVMSLPDSSSFSANLKENQLLNIKPNNNCSASLVQLDLSSLQNELSRYSASGIANVHIPMAVSRINELPFDNINVVDIQDMRTKHMFNNNNNNCANGTLEMSRKTLLGDQNDYEALQQNINLQLSTQPIREAVSTCSSTDDRFCNEVADITDRNFPEDILSNNINEGNCETASIQTFSGYDKSHFSDSEETSQYSSSHRQKRTEIVCVTRPIDSILSPLYPRQQSPNCGE